MPLPIPWRPTPAVLRQFAALWLALVAGLACWRLGPLHVATLALAAVGVAGLMWPPSVRWLFVALVIVTSPIGWLVSRGLLACLYFGFITPLALVFRLSGRDALLLRRAERETYWQPRPQREPASYYHQF